MTHPKRNSNKLTLIKAPFNILKIFQDLGMGYCNESWIAYNTRKIEKSPELILQYMKILLDKGVVLETLKKELDKRKHCLKKRRKPLNSPDRIIPYEAEASDILLKTLGTPRLSLYQNYLDPEKGLDRLKKDTDKALSILTVYINHTQVYMNGKALKKVAQRIKENNERFASDTAEQGTGENESNVSSEKKDIPGN